MAFVQIERNRKYTSPVTDSVSMGLYLADGKELKTRSVVFLISRSIIDKLKWELTDNNRTRVMVFEGTGTDEGFLMIVPTAENGYTLSAGNKATEKTSFRFALQITKFRHYVMNDTHANSAPVQFAIDGNALIIECPDWIKFNPLTAPVEEPAPEPEPEPEPEPVVIPVPIPETPAPVPQYAAFTTKKRRGRPPKGGQRHA